jgi:hypothetical protein
LLFVLAPGFHFQIDIRLQAFENDPAGRGLAIANLMGGAYNVCMKLPAALLAVLTALSVVVQVRSCWECEYTGVQYPPPAVQVLLLECCIRLPALLCPDLIPSTAKLPCPSLGRLLVRPTAANYSTLRYPLPVLLQSTASKSALTTPPALPLPPPNPCPAPCHRPSRRLRAVTAAAQILLEKKRRGETRQGRPSRGSQTGCGSSSR